MIEKTIRVYSDVLFNSRLARSKGSATSMEQAQGMKPSLALMAVMYDQLLLEMQGRLRAKGNHFLLF